MVGKEQSGKGFVLCAGHTGSVQQLSEWKAVVHKQGTPVASLAPRSVQTALACAFAQPSRKSKLHKVLKQFFIFSFQRILFFNCSVI